MWPKTKRTEALLQPLAAVIAGTVAGGGVTGAYEGYGVEAFIESLGLRPLDVGGLKMAHWLEGTGLVVMGLARHGVGNWDFALGVTEFPG